MLPRAHTVHPVPTRRGGSGCGSGGATLDRIPQTGTGGCVEFCTTLPVRRVNALGCTVRPWRWLDGMASGPQRKAMPDAPSEYGGDGPLVDPARPLDGRGPLVDWLYAQSQSGRWGL